MRLVLPLAVLPCCLLIACGGEDGGDDGPRHRDGLARRIDPVPRETVRDAVDRVRGAATASDCEAVKGLLHSTYGQVSDRACAAIKMQIDGFRDPRGAAFGTGAAIDFDTTTGQHRLMALALDADGTYRVAFVADVPERATGTPRAPAFDRNARAVARAMQSGDCRAFLRLASRGLGLGVGGDPEVCRRVSDAPFRRELVANRRARPVALGGNASVAFYKLRTRADAYYTMVMMAEPPRGSAPPRYLLVNAWPAG